MAVRTIPTLDSPPLQRFGLPSLEYGTSPAAAADFVQKIEGNYYVRLVSVFCRLVTDSNAADRQVVLEYRDAATNRFAISGSGATQAASLTGDWFFTAFQMWAAATADSTVLAPLSPILLAPTMDFRLHVVSAQAADQLSRIRFVWERFFTSGEPG
jgi:hypothetical protein